MAYNILQKLNANLSAIRVALEWEKGTPLSEEDITALKKHAGFGGIKAILYPDAGEEEWVKQGATEADLRLHPSIAALHQLLTDRLTKEEYGEVVRSLKNSVLTAFYTPEVVPVALFDALKESGIRPRHIYEPSAGAGVFITEAAKAFPSLESVTAVEKDLLTGRVLAALCSSLPVPADVHISGFERMPVTDNGEYDLIVSNIPFGNFSVYDPDFPDKELSGKIHNYFFAKGLDKIASGGLLAYITTDAFLNNPSNKTAREYLFSRADFISLAVLPDNLMKDTGNTEAPSHLLIVQKNGNKKGLGEAERQLIATIQKENEFGSYSINQYITGHPEILTGNEIKAGKNQYGQAHQAVWQNGDLSTIRPTLSRIFHEGFEKRFDRQAFKNAPLSISLHETGKTFTFLPPPEDKTEAGQVQLGLFDTAAPAATNRALAYLDTKDEGFVHKQTARIISTIKTTRQPTHESIVLLAAQTGQHARYQYKLCSNIKEIGVPAGWMQANALTAALANLSGELKQYSYHYLYEGDTTLEAAFSLNAATPVALSDVKPFYKDGMLAVHQGKVGRISSIDEEFRQADFRELPLQSHTDFYNRYITLRDCYLELSAREVGGEATEESLRKELNDQYERFTGQYGLLNLPVNKRLIAEDNTTGLMITSSLERREGDTYVKADILQQSLQRKEEHFTTDDPVAALARCLNDRGKVAIDFIEAATGLSDTEVINSLTHHIYLNPLNSKWETADQYLSGNVVEKLRIAEDQANQFPDNSQFKKSLEAIREVQPEKIPFELLDFNLGERWIPAAYYDRFASELLEQETKVRHLPSLDVFKVDTEGHNAKVTQEYAVKPKSGRTMCGYTVLEHALENTAPFFTYEVDLGDRTVRVPDNEAIQLAHQKIENIRARFGEWLQELPGDDKKALEDLYNDTFNCYVLREYDGNHLMFPGLDKKALDIEDLYSSQKNAAWRIIQNRGALIDHEVGLGKTLTMIVSAHEMKRLGIVHKPIILALKSNIDQIRDTYRKAYPGDRLLAPGENDFTPTKRMRLFHEIKNNNWDCIILTHDQFGKIPQSSEIQREILQTELGNVERDLETLKEQGGSISKKILKGLEVRKSNLAGKLKGVLYNIEQKKDAGISFGELGVDHLFVDESHKFKNLAYTTRHNRVAGLGNTEGSQKALNMLFAVRTLQQKFDADLCVTFLSGTPISNSLTEMYLIFKYLRPKEMERQHIENFDAWAAVFARKTTDFEFSVTNEIIAKERFRHFIKVPELALFYNEITDYKTARHISLDKPDLDEMLVNIAPTPDQQAFSKKLMAFARTGDASLIDRAPLSREEDKGRMLIATNYAKKMAADMRLISGKYADHPGNKVSVCARKIAEIYHETQEHKGTQLVFCDIGTPKPGIFNIYDALKEKLVVDFDIPADEITFIHDWSEKKKPALFQKMNSGVIRAAIGSTDKLGTGTNVQERVVAMHHIDIPWKPAELEQRNGRGARQGNRTSRDHYGNKVRNYIYAVEQSLDNYKFNLLKNKQTFISQMKNCELNVRTIDEGAIDEKSGMNFSEYIAILSGDTSLLEKSRLEKKIAVLESLKKAHFKEMAHSRHKLEELQEDKEQAEKIRGQLTNDESFYKSRLQYEKDGTKANPIQLNQLRANTPESIGKHIIKLYQRWDPSQEAKIGSLYGFDLYIRQHREAFEDQGNFGYRTYNTFYAERPGSGIKYTYNQGHPNVDNPKLTARHFLNAIDRVSTLKEKYGKTIAELDKEIPVVEKMVHKPFEKETALSDMKRELARLEREISIRIQENQLQQHAQEDKELKKEEDEILKRTPVIKMDPEGQLVQERQPKYAVYRHSPPRMRKAKGFRM